MPTQYTSFQIKNTGTVAMAISVNDPNGAVHSVGIVDPGEVSIQLAPIDATWSTESASPAAQENVETPPTIETMLISEPATSEKSSDTIASGTSKPGASITRSPLQDDTVELTECEVFLKLETGTHTARINQLLVTPDGKTLITSGESTIRVWDVETKEPVRMLLGQVGAGGNGDVQRIALSRDGKYVVAFVFWKSAGASDQDTDVCVYELATGNLQAGFRYEGELQNLDFSPDGKYLAITGNPKQPIRCGRVEVYRWSDFLKGFGRVPAPIASEALFDLPAVIPAMVRFVPTLPGASAEYRIVVATWYQHRDQQPEYTGGLLWYSFTPDGRLTKLPASRETEKRIAPNHLAVSHEYVVVGSRGDCKDLFCHDHEGKLVKTIPTEFYPAAPTFSLDGSRLIVGQSGDGALVQVNVYDIAHGQFQLKSTYYGHDAEVVAVAFLQDGTVVSAGGDQNTIHFWNPSHIEGEQTGIISSVGRVVHAVGINPAEQIGIGNRDDQCWEDGAIVFQRAFDLRAMTLSAFSFKDVSTFRRAQVSAGEQWLEWKLEGEYTNLFLMQKNKKQALTGIRDPDRPGSILWYTPTTFGFAERKETIITGASDGVVRVAPQSTNGTYQAPRRLLVGHTASVRDHAACGRWLVTGGADQTIRLWYLEDVEQDSLEPLEPALTLFVGSDDEWVIWSKSGYYNASQHGDRRFGYHVNRGTDKEALYFPSDRFIKVFFRPDIIQTIVETGSEEAAIKKLAERGLTTSKFDVSQILPPIVELIEDGVIPTQEDVTFTFTVKALNLSNDVTRIWIVQNEQFACESRDQQGKYTVKLPLLPGRNRIKIIAESRTAKSNPIELSFRQNAPQTGGLSSGSETAHADLSPTSPAAPTILLGDNEHPLGSMGTLYVLAVGVSTLAHQHAPFNNLRFAHLDAIAIYNALAKGVFSSAEASSYPSRNAAFRAVDATLLLNEKANKRDINLAVDEICNKIRKQHLKEPANRNVLLVFLSGHGMVSESDQELYFWNHDLDFDDKADTGLAFIELGEKITSVPAEVILMTDACRSGMAGSEVVKGIDPNELAKRIYGINERGMYILNAARSYESAIAAGWSKDENKNKVTIDHGYFTKSILEVLENNTNVSMWKLIEYVQERVPYYTLDKGYTRQTPVFQSYGTLLRLVIYQGDRGT